jgi:hypothetical protein
MIVEGSIAAVDEHMVADISGVRLYPDGLHIRSPPACHEGMDKDAACAAREEDTT